MYQMMSVSQRSWCLSQEVRKLTDDNVNPLDSISEPRVDLPENEDTSISFSCK